MFFYFIHVKVLAKDILLKLLFNPLHMYVQKILIIDKYKPDIQFSRSKLPNIV